MSFCLCVSVTRPIACVQACAALAIPARPLRAAWPVKLWCPCDVTCECCGAGRCMIACSRVVAVTSGCLPGHGGGASVAGCCVCQGTWRPALIHIWSLCVAPCMSCICLHLHTNHSPCLHSHNSRACMLQLPGMQWHVAVKPWCHIWVSSPGAFHVSES